MAKDLVRELKKQGINEIDVILVSSLDGIPRFKSMYGDPVDGRLSIEGTNVGLSSLEEFDAVENTVVSFVDANRCKHSSSAFIKRVISPDTKFQFIGNVNQNAFSDLFTQFLYRMQAKQQQLGLYDAFDDQDMQIGSAGLGQDRLGIPSITKSEDLPTLSLVEQSQVPQGEYGFMYIAAVDSSKDYKLIAQYIKLSGKDTYTLVGQFTTKQTEIRYAFDDDLTLITSKAFPKIDYHQSLPYGVMRQTAANSSSILVLSTGVTSTLEAMRDKKLPYYQDMDNNTEFVAAYLIAVKSMVSSDTTLFSVLPDMIIELSKLLFANKPLSRMDMERTNELLELHSVSSRLVNTNQSIIDQASGKIAPKLLSFLGESRKTKDPVQLATVCASLRKSGEMGSPVHDQALRRAATWGRLFELKVLIKSMCVSDLDKVDPNYGRAALHWAVGNKNFDCACVLIKSGASIDLQDKKGQTPLHNAVKNGDKPMIKMLIEAGASVDIPDNSKSSPKDCTLDSGLLLFINDCHSHLNSNNI
jgi:ankyrin repeat protein